MNDEVLLDFKGILQIIRRRRWIVILITFLSIGTSCVLSYWVIEPVYEAKTTILIGKSIEGNDDRINYDDILLYQKVVRTYTEIAKSRLVAENAADRLGNNISPDIIMENVSVSTQQDTQVMIIKTRSTVPEDAMNMVNCLAESFIQKCQELLPTGVAKVLDRARLPQHPVLPRHKVNIIIGFFTGILISLIIIFTINYFDNTIKTDEELERYTNIPVLGIIPKDIKTKRS